MAILLCLPLLLYFQLQNTLIFPSLLLTTSSSQSFLYGSSVHHLSPSLDTSAFDLYLTDPSESSRKADRLPNPTMSLFRKPESNFLPWKNKPKPSVPKTVPVKPPKPVTKKVSTGLDKDIEALQSSLAAHNAEKLENAYGCLWRLVIGIGLTWHTGQG